MLKCVMHDESGAVRRVWKREAKMLVESGCWHYIRKSVYKRALKKGGFIQPLTTAKAGAR